MHQATHLFSCSRSGDDNSATRLVARVAARCLMQEKLEEFITAANSGDNCHLVIIPAGVLPSDVLITSPIVSADGHGGGGGSGGMGAGGGGDFGGVADFGGEMRRIFQLSRLVQVCVCY